MKTSVIIISLATLVVGTQDFDPFSIGPHKVHHSTYYPFFNSDLHNMVDVWVPDIKEPLKAPVLLFVGAFGGLISGNAYKQLFDRVASHGFAVVQPWMLGNNPISNYEGVWLESVLAWTEAHLKEKLTEEGVASGVELDHENIILMGHSAGSHVGVEYLKHHCGNVKGSLFMSPVDGVDPYGIIHMNAITPGDYLNYALPTLVIMAGLDPVKGINGLGDLVPACAPDDMSNIRFYDAMPDNTWFINATDYGHGDCLDDSFANAIEWTHFCSSADDDKSRDEYRRFLAGEMVTFVKLILGQEDCDIVRFMEEPSLMPISTTVQQKGSCITDLSACKQGRCLWQEEPYPHNVL